MHVRLELIAVMCFSAIVGGLAGAAAGLWTSSSNPDAYSTMIVRSTSTTPVVQLSTTTLALIPVERRAAAALVPPAFLSRRSSPVASLYRKPKGTTIEDRTLEETKLLGQAVAVTADGWFVTQRSVLEGVRFADVVVWHEGKSYAVEQGMTDAVNGTVFLRTAARGLPVTAFAHVSELDSGAEVWIESRAKALAPSVVLQTSGQLSPNEAVSSDVASRRMVLEGTTRAGDRGGAAWDPNGSLIGLIESLPGERIRILPSSSVAASLSSLLSSSRIIHASLGVRSIDLGTLRVDGPRGDLPAQGAWVREVKKNSAAAIAGVRVGDVILRVERDILDGTADLGEILSEYRSGTSVTLRLMRGVTDMDLPVKLGELVTSEPLK